MTVPFDARRGDFKAFEHYHALFRDDEGWEAWKRSEGMQWMTRNKRGKDGGAV